MAKSEQVFRARESAKYDRDAKAIVSTEFDDHPLSRDIVKCCVLRN